MSNFPSAVARAALNRLFLFVFLKFSPWLKRRRSAGFGRRDRRVTIHGCRRYVCTPRELVRVTIACRRVSGDDDGPKNRFDRIDSKCCSNDVARHLTSESHLCAVDDRTRRGWVKKKKNNKKRKNVEKRVCWAGKKLFFLPLRIRLRFTDT